MSTFVQLPSVYPPALHQVNRGAVVAVDAHSYTVPTQGLPLVGSAVHLASGLILHVALAPVEVVALLESSPPA